MSLLTGSYRRHPDVDTSISLVGLPDKRAARVKALSGGQHRRLDLALGPAMDPELLFLDEPTGSHRLMIYLVWNRIAGRDLRAMWCMTRR